MTNETKFRPVSGTDKSIQSTSNHPGWVYFASDSGKIYFDFDEDNRIVMGGSGATIFYAEENEPNESRENIFELHIEKLEESTSFPKEGDIIINSDKCFYRALEIIEEDGIIECSRIAIAGSGSGSGGSGTGEAAGTASVSQTTNTLDTLYGDSCIIEFTVESKDASGDDTIGGTVTWFLDGKKFYSMPVSPGVNTFDVGPYLKNAVQAQILKGSFSLDVGTDRYEVRTKSWSITTVDVNMTWNYNLSNIVTGNNLLLNWNVTGGASVPKTTHIIIDGVTEITQLVSKVGAQSISIPRNENNLSHGKHKIEMYVSYVINNTTKLVPSITHEITVVDSDNNTPIIAVGDYKTNIKQYDTTMIPLYIFNSSSAKLYVDGELQEEWNDIEQSETSSTLRYWSYSSTEPGTHRLVVTCGSVEAALILEVESLNLSTEETSGYAFKIKSSDFSSNNALKTWSYKTPENENVSITFSDNFDWINGGLQQEEDENGNLRQYICAKAGTYFTINYDLFKAQNQYGKDIKVVFKVTNCGKYDAEVIRSYDDTDHIGLLMTAQEAIFKSSSNSIKTQYCEDNYIEYEIDITPYKDSGIQCIMPWLAGVPAGITTFNTDSFQQNEQRRTKIKVGSADCDVYLYMFKVYEKHLTDEEHLENFIMDALNAEEILNRYNRNDVLSDLGNGEIDWAKVVAKNPNCWVHLYTIPRICKTKKDEIGKTYLSEIGEGIESTAETAKYYALYKDGNSQTPVIEAGTDVGCPFTYKVQGTSSEKYVISAANLDTNFKKGFVDSEGNKINKFALDDTVPAENYFNTKVNVASCEGANNALNVYWYNKYQPYKSAAKARNPKKRDTMLFKPGIVFIKDENKNYEKTAALDNLDLNVFKGNDVYKNDPFHKQYAICNFGNSKKNKATLHDTNNPSEICIEVTDNQNIGQHMCQVSGRREVAGVDNDGNATTTLEVFDITNQTLDCWLEDSVDDNGEAIKVLKGNETFDAFYYSMDDNDFDVRYTSGDDGVDNATPQQIKGFFDLLKWFALNDPSEYNASSHPHGYTNEPFTASTPNATLYSNPNIIIDGNLYLDNEGNTTVAAEDLQEGITYYKLKTWVDGETEYSAFVEAENGVDYTLTGYGVTFAPYTFKDKITFETGDGYSHTYTTQLGGTRISTYAKTYFKDSHEYRMAKLLFECEDHLIMDSIVYHYLFIEKHLMVDNVAKNTFWSSEDKDNKYWSLIKDYDNDTADGIDNDGKLSFTYGIEPTDLQDGGLSYFNAPNTVWFNFLHGLGVARKALYNKLRSGIDSVFSVQKYLELFDEWQSAIPERCWIEDYYRKYIRPKELFEDSSYLAKLEGGQKKYQRKQFEIYQNDYLNSKYQYTDGESIYLRANEEHPENVEIPVTMYSDCYVYQSWAQNIVNSRVKRGETYNIKVPSTISRLDDATVYWYLPQTYSTIGDLGTINPKGITLGGASRLQSLSVTSKDGEMISLKTKDSLSIGQATLIRHLVLKGLKSDEDSFALNISNLKSLQDFNGENSLFTSIEFPIGAPLTSIKINNPGLISMRDLYQLQTLNIADYSNLHTVLIDNIDINEDVNSLDDIVLKATNLSKYCLHNVNWKITDSNLIDDNGIAILDSIATMTPYDIEGKFVATSHKDSLTGTLTIAASAYSGDKSLEIYEKYIEIFPNLEIVFESPNCKLYEVTILDGNDKVAWSKKFKGSVQLTKDFLSNGGSGDLRNLVVGITKSKSDTTYYTYSFAGAWECNEDEIEVQCVKVGEEYDIDTFLPISTKTYSENIVIKPKYNESTRFYTISFYLDPTSEEVYAFGVNAGVTVKDMPQLKTLYPTRSNGSLTEDEAYKFTGWSLTKNGDVLKNFENITILSNYNFYANYKIINFKNEGMNELVIDSKYFEILETTFPMENGYNYTTTKRDNLPQEQVQTGGVYINFVKGFNQPEGFTNPDLNLTKGKIFLPTKINNKPVFGIFEKYGATPFQPKNVTHVYWNIDESSQVYQICNGVFSGWSSLEYFQIPKTLKIIDTNAFSSCYKLKMPRLIDSQVIVLGASCFSNCTNLGGEVIIPGNLTTNLVKTGSPALGNNAFLNCRDGCTDVKLGITDNLIAFNMTDIGNSAFKGCNKLKTIELYPGNTTDISETTLTEDAIRIFGQDGLSGVQISTVS